MQNIDILKASGIDKFPGKILKDGAEILAKSIAEICNLPITSRTFSIAYKVVKLKPIFKKGKKNCPILLQTYFIVTISFKIFERILHDQANELIKENNLLHYYQSAFKTYN